MMKEYRSQGMSQDEAMKNALSTRIRPIIMTTLAAVLALLPLAVGIGAGAQMQRPLAIAVIGGFSVSSILLFLALSPIYRLMKKP